jgi:hypothetical protein
MAKKIKKRKGKVVFIRLPKELKSALQKRTIGGWIPLSTVCRQILEKECARELNEQKLKEEENGK